MMYSTNILLNLISTIFKTINSSVDDTRKTLALFNKDWNTYKTNWQQGFASNGFAGGVKSIFQSTKSVVSSEQIQMLRTWNNAVKHGCTNQETFNKIIANADHNTKMYFAGLNKGKGTLDGLKNAQNATKASTIGLTIAQTALNMAISMGLTLAISAAIKGFDKMMNSAKRASEAADEAFEETSSKVQEQQEELKTLDELISKYKELKKDGTLDIEGRKEVKELQNDIADLVGTQAKNLDLVNGKLDDEIEKLNEISAKEAKTAYETATANYNNSQRAKDNATGDDSFLFDGWAYVGKREKDPENVLKEYGFGGSIANSRIAWWSNTQISDNFDKDGKQLKGAEEKRDYLQSMIDVLEQNGQRATELYSGLISQRDKYQQYIDNQQGAANSLVNSWITYSQYSNEELSKITVDSVESFETYRQKMIEAAKNDESVGKLLSDGTLSEKDLEVAVNDFMATSTKFSDWYKQWIGDVQSSTSLNKMNISLSEMKTASDNISALSSAFKQLSDDGYMSTESISKIKEAVGDGVDNWEEYEKVLMNAKAGSEEYNQAMTDLTYGILDQTFAGKDLTDVTEDKIEAVLRENGVTNASAIAHEYLAYAKAQEKAESVATALATDASSVSLAMEAAQCGLTEAQFRNLIIQQILFNQTNLDVGQKLTALQELGLYANWTAEQLAKVQNTTITYSDGKWWVNSYAEDADGDGELDYLGSQEYQGYQPAINPSDFKVSVPKYSSGKSGGSGSGSNKDTVNEKLKKDIDKVKSQIEAYDTSIELQDLRIDIAYDNDFETKMDAISNKIGLVTSKTKALKDEYNRLNSITPTTEEQTETLKSRMGELVKEISSSIKETAELRQELELMNIEIISNSIEQAEGRLNRMSKRLENDLDRIANGKVFGSDLFSMPLPTSAISSDSLNRKKKDNEDTIKEQQKRLDELYGAVQLSNEAIAEENARARLEDEEKLAEHADKNIETTELMTDGIETDIANSNTFLENNPIEPKLDITEFKAEYDNLKGMVDSIQGMMNDGVPIEVDSSSANSRRYTNTSKKPNEIQGSEEGDGTSKYTMKVDAPSLTESDNLKAAYQASKLIGTPYIWGGTSTTGFDCSGLIYYVYGGLGKNIGRVADDQYRSGTPVDKNNLRMGDLVFYGTPEEATHVGMYIGKGMMIHSAGGRDNTADNPGKGVCRQSIDYRSDYLGARRYAVGTPKGNEYGKYTGIMAENYKPEILINKATGEMSYHDTPTAFDIREYDVMGEDMTASLPKFASGTVDPMEIAAYIRQNYPEITDVGIAAILGNIEVESSFNPRETVIEPYGSGSNTPTWRGGLFQLDDGRIREYNRNITWSDIVKNGTWQQQVDIALAEAKSGSGIGYDAFTKILTNPSLSAGEAARLWDANFERSKGNTRDVRASNAERYLAQIQGNTDALNANTSAITAEELAWARKLEPYNDKEAGRQLEELKEENNQPRYADEEDAQMYSEYAKQWSTKNAELKAEREELNKLNPHSAVYKAAQKELIAKANEYAKQNAEFIGNFQLDVLRKTGNYYRDQYDKTLQMYNEYIESGGSDPVVLQGYIDELSDIYDKIIDIENEQNNTLESIIETNRRIIDQDIKRYTDKSAARDYAIEDGDYWYDITGDTEYKRKSNQARESKLYQEYETQAFVHSEAEKSRKKLEKYDTESWFDNSGEFTQAYYDFVDQLTDEGEKILVTTEADKLRQYKQAYMESDEAIKTLISDLISGQAELYHKEMERAISQTEAEITLLTKHHDVINSIKDAQHNINKELQASMTMYAYLDEETRKLLFNQEDYNALNAELNALNEEANRLQTQYLSDIAYAEADEISNITAEYERQYEVIMKKYEIAKAELEVSKKRQQLDNVLNEKNVRMLINGQWQWVANTQDVINAQNELADAEYQKQQAESGLSQTAEVQELQAHRDRLTLQNQRFDAELGNMMLNFDKLMTEFGLESSSILEFFGGIIHNMGDAISMLVGSDVIKDSRDKATSESKPIGDGVYYSQEQIKNMTPEQRSEAWHGASEESKYYLHKANEEHYGDTHDFTDLGEWIAKDGSTFVPQESNSLFSSLSSGNLGLFNTIQPIALDTIKFANTNAQNAKVTNYNLYGDVSVDSAVDADDMLNSIADRFRVKQ